MAQGKEDRRRNMSIFPGYPTQRWAILIKSLRDTQMASISNRKALGKATSLPGAPSGPVCSPFGRLDGAIKGRSEEHTSELQSLMRISYDVFCLKKKKNARTTPNNK